MIWFCLGTSGELIKVYSLIHHCKMKGIPWRVVTTGQSAIHFWKQWDDFKLPRESTVVLNDTTDDLKSSGQAAKWFFGGLLQSATSLRAKIESKAGAKIDPKKDFWIVHGDTLSSVVGVEYGKRLGLRVGHVESGLTSGSVFEPFPEELCRRWTSRRADICFAPNEEARVNLIRRGVPGRAVCTQGNTLMDSVRLITQEIEAKDIPSFPYALVNAHRYENLHTPSRWEKITKILLKASKNIRLMIVLHPGTEHKLLSDPKLLGELEANGTVLLERRPFSQFIHLVARASFLLSDGGSNQQESSYLGVPCLLLRDRTESEEGMKSNCILSRFDEDVVARFLEEPDRHRFPVNTGGDSPTQRVMTALEES